MRASAATMLLFAGGCAWSPPSCTVSAAAHLHASVQRRASAARLVAAANSLDGGTSRMLRPSAIFGDQPPTLSLVAPAKVNLFLRILRKREDGFHELASLFQTVSLFDDLDFWLLPREADQPLCSMEVTPDSLRAELIPTDGSNLVMRALQLYAERVPSAGAVHCRLHKRIPAQGGLGGGSSDAATALHAANRLAGSPVPQDTLIEWAGELGSDCGFFLSRGSAYCTGRGEIVSPVAPLPPAACFLIKPADGLSTPSVFKELGLQPGQSLPGLDPLELLDGLQRDVFNAALYVNDLEPPAFKLMPRLKQMCDDLRKLGFRAVMMSGSGTTCFAVGSPAEEVLETWRSQLSAKYNVEVFEEAFCGRTDDTMWYTER